MKTRIPLSPAFALLILAVAFQARTALAATPRPPFLVRSYDGTKKCLDYGTLPPVAKAVRLDRALPSREAPREASRLLSPARPAPPTVFLNDCAHAHPIVVEELQNGRHEVILHAGKQVLGIRRPRLLAPAGVTASAPAGTAEFPLELLDQGIHSSAFVDDVFALDGDSILLASSRPCSTTDSTLCPPPPPQRVVRVENARGTNGTPLVVGPRNLVDSEFWDFVATDGSDTDPDSGFVRVATAGELWNALCAIPVAPTYQGPSGHFSYPPNGPCVKFQAGWGSVIKVAPGEDEDASIDLGGYPPLILPAGVTLRGDRRGTKVGPQINDALHQERQVISPAIADAECEWCMIQIHGDYVRVTGLRLRGPSRSKDELSEAPSAIAVDFPKRSLDQHASATEFIAIVDRNDVSDWEGSGVSVLGGQSGPASCDGVLNDPRTQDNVHIERNFLHHNEEWGEGYGTVMSAGRAVILGNTFLMNRHAIASDAKPWSEYRAWYNLVLSNVPTYSITQGGAQQDFDMHGSVGGYSGVAGNRVDIAGNTFLGGDRFNFELRGHPCFVPFFRDNVTRRSRGDHAINLHKTGDPSIDVTAQTSDVPVTPVSVPPYVAENVFPIVVGGVSAKSDIVLSDHNQFADSSPGFADPTGALRVGDFDGDGVQDLFLATGTAWYYAPGSVAEWRLLRPRTDKAETLLFGDFDGDGRTDVVGKNGDRLMVSWGGVSDWEVLNPNAAGPAIQDLAVGNFTGDSRDDIFWADGRSWRVSDHGAEPFQVSQTSSFRIPDLRFGDFDGDGQTDVFGIVGGRWQISHSAKSSWAALPVSLTNTLNGLVVADFNGDGRADIAMSRGDSGWWISSGGSGPWTQRSTHGTAKCNVAKPTLSAAPAVGHFAGTRSADVLVWNGRDLCIVPGGSGDPQPWSRQEMK